MRNFTLLVALAYSPFVGAGQFDELTPSQPAETVRIRDRREIFLRAQIRAIRLETNFVEERVARTRRELRIELSALSIDLDAERYRELEQEVREIFAQREVRLLARISTLKKELEKLEQRLAKGVRPSPM